MQKKQKLRSATGQLERLLPDTDLSKRNNDLRSISALSRVPVIKATVQSYAVEQGTVNFKILVHIDNYPQRKLKKTYEEFLDLDQMLQSKYSKYLRMGVFTKSDLPDKATFNFNNLQSIEQFKNHLRQYLDSLSNELNTSINESHDDGQSQQKDTHMANFLPRELLIFYNLDLIRIDQIMSLQEQLINPLNQTGDVMNETNLYGKDLDFIVQRSDDVKKDLKLFLLNVLKREDLFTAKIDCIQKNVTLEEAALIGDSGQKQSIQVQAETESVIFTFQINKCFVFQKTMREVEKFCKDITGEIKNPVIQQMGDLFSFCYAIESVDS